jgi:hypothetical protein
VSAGATAALTREIAGTGRGLIRLARYDARWAEDFDFSTTGFFRSFFAPVLALPFTLVLAALAVSNGGAKPFTSGDLLAAGVSHVTGVAAFAVLVALIARPFGLTAGYAAFMILVNWSGLFITLAACAAAALTLFGATGLGLFGFAWILLFLIQFYIIWRAARETLSADYGPAVLMVVLSVAIGAASNAAGNLAAALLT